MPRPTRVLTIGDSISIGYTPFVAEMLTGQAEIGHNPGNGGDSDNVLANMDAWLAEAGADVVHLNCGLHDLKVARDTRAHQVPLERYRRNLTEIGRRLAACGALPVWASSTAVIDARHNAVKEFDRHNADVDAYNAAAGEIMLAAGIRINDLHAAAIAAGIETVVCDDGVHMTDGGYAILAQAVADCIRKALGGK